MVIVKGREDYRRELQKDMYVRAPSCCATPEAPSECSRQR